MENLNALFTDTIEQSVDGVAFKNFNLKKSILAYFANEGKATIAELSKVLNISSPKITEILHELASKGLVKDYGKVEAGVGRKPILYGLNSDSLFFIGADIKKDYINIGMLDFNKKMVSSRLSIPYHLANTPEALNLLCKIIIDFINKQKQKNRIAGVGLNLTGRVNYKTGYSFSYFHFKEAPLSESLENELNLPVFLENDSRA